jgi:hypothetical protein
MDWRRKYLIQGAAPYPHVGRLIEKKVNEKKITYTEVAKRMGVNSTTVKAYFEQPSVQLGILWKIGVALDHNFFGDLVSDFPVKLNDDVALQQALKEKDDEILDLKKEIAIYKGILMRNG